ncbi:MAG: 2OG-Fe dioxygenase family protein [Luteimonas sp.]
MTTTFSAPFTPVEALLPALRERGYAVLTPDSVVELCGIAVADLQALMPSWGDLPPDGFLRDGGSYRRRRHSCFVVDDAQVAQAPHRAHWQSETYNALHGGMQRWFEPIAADIVARPVWSRMLQALACCFAEVRPTRPWYVEAHQFRIDTSDGIGRPTPEGAHRDGVDFVAVFIVARHGIKGGESRVFEAAGPNGQRFTLDMPWSLLLLDDARMIHESTPIQPEQPGDSDGYRDTLVLTYRAGAFQGDD